MKVNVALAVVLLLVGISVFAGLTVWIQSTDMSALSYGPYVQAIFSTGAMTVAVTLLVNIAGFIENAVGATQEVQYEAKQLGVTFARYTVYMGVFSSSLLALTQGTKIYPYATLIAAGVSLAFDLVKRSLDKLATPTTPATPAPPSGRSPE